ncbi:hypothetical protein [Halalkalibacter lacteus]|uniref:magnesium chelatase subunit ChlI family protein n=1 Tax=Halalkalibacter lacteus TaxID=3090663 RepID=UPI002FC6BB94
MNFKIIRLARTIADLKGEESVSNESLLMAIRLRKLKNKVMMDRDMLTGEKGDVKY